jgi:sec-independent protein translocase protein TatB
MIDFGFDKIALIGVVALVVIGPEKLPRVARTIGHVVGKAQRYVADVKAEVNRSIELEELQKMKSQFENAARDVQSAAQDMGQSVSGTLNEAASGLDPWNPDSSGSGSTGAYEPLAEPVPVYKHPGKNWRLKRGAMPQWYKQRHGVRTKAQSGAARVARFRPPGVR